MDYDYDSNDDYAFRGDWAPRLSSAELKARSQRMQAKLEADGTLLYPAVAHGKNIASSFWGQAWCKHLASYSDYESRLPSGRTYLRNGAVLDLNITKEHVHGKVYGSILYETKIHIAGVDLELWTRIKDQCSGQIESLMELLKGKIEESVIKIIADPETGLFPKSSDLKFSCTCPDWAHMCKHVAALLYGVGARLDDRPEDLFLLRGVDHRELIGSAGDLVSSASKESPELEGVDIADLFDIEFDK